MKRKFILNFLILTSLFNSNIFSQNISSIPPMAMPSGSNAKLIDQLVEVSGLQEYFIWYCEEAIDSAAAKKGWSATKVSKIKESIDFEQFKTISVYNTFSALTAEEINLQIKFYKSLAKREKNKDFCLWSYILGFNIRSFAERYLDE